MLGDALILKFDQGQHRTGANFNYHLGGNADTLSFGQIVTLGDFYSDQSTIGHCQQQISDPGLTDQQRCDLFQAIVTKLNTSYSEDPSTLKCILNILSDAYLDTSQAPDPAQEYATKLAGIGGWDALWLLCTQAYVGVALCNADHFGLDAITAYTAGHTVALKYAMASKDNWDLLDAYFYEAFAQHYLSDIFSAGHFRTPRRALHVDPLGFTFDFPADDCNRNMHDEDSANGLWVNNLAGESWPLFGDKQAGASKSFWNRQQAIAAMQAGADELLQVFQSQKMIAPADYKALQLVPIASLADPHQNFVPLFAFDNTTNQVNMRSNIDDRGDQNTITYNASALATSDSWIPIKNSISNQGVMTNMYPRTIQGWPLDLTSETNLTQIRPVNTTHLLINQYGPLWTKMFQYVPNQTAQRSWNMIKQEIGANGIDPAMGDINWSWSETISSPAKTIVLAGSNQEGSFLLGLQQQTTGGLKPIWTVPQKSEFKCSLNSNAPHTVGSLSPGAPVAFTQYCGVGTGSYSPFFQVWTYSSSSPTATPEFLSSFNVLDTEYRYTFMVFNVTFDAYTFVDIAYNAANRSNLWTFKRWTNNYANEETAEYWESTFQSPDNLIYLTDILDSNNPRLIRISDSDHAITVFTLTFGGISSTTATGVRSPFTCDSESYHLITVPTSPSQAYLVGYCRGNTDEIAITTYHYTPGSLPMLTSAGQTLIPATYLPLFNSAFMAHITTHVAQLYDINTQAPYNPPQFGIMELFDNYGIIGARLFALDPTQTSQVGWRPIGQYPAIAGQISNGLTSIRDGSGFMFE